MSARGVFWLAAVGLLATLGCVRNEPCRTNTVLVEIVCDGEWADADALTVTLEQRGESKVETISPVACPKTLRLEVSLSSYTDGIPISAIVTASRAGIPFGGKRRGEVTTESRCTRLSVSSAVPTNMDARSSSIGGDALESVGKADAPLAVDAAEGVDARAATDVTQPRDVGALATVDAQPDAAIVGAPPVCPSGQHRCPGLDCVKDTDPATCGASCTACASVEGGAPTCDGKKCGVSCPAGKQLCKQRCIGKDEPCDGTCPTGTHNCDGLCSSDSEVNTCGTRCAPCGAPPSGGKATCVGGVCGIACDTGNKLCESESRCIPTGGCCATSECGENKLCSANKCICKPGFVVCGAGCIPEGACCGDGDCKVTNGSSSCTANACSKPTCTTGYFDCDTNPKTCEANTSADTSCGGCGRVCPTGTCLSGKCRVRSGLVGPALSSTTRLEGAGFYVWAFRLARGGALRTLGVRVASGTGKIKIAIYADAGGKPGARLARTDELTVSATGLVDAPVLEAATLTAGSYYIGASSASSSVYAQNIDITADSWAKETDHQFGPPIDFSTSTAHYGTALSAPEISAVVDQDPQQQ